MAFSLPIPAENVCSNYQISHREQNQPQSRISYKLFVECQPQSELNLNHAKTSQAVPPQPLYVASTQVLIHPYHA